MVKVSCHVTVSINALSINFIEQAVLEGARGAGKKLFLAFLELKEKMFTKGHTCNCGGHFESLSRIGGELMSIAGDIVFSRQRVRCLRCGLEKYPLDGVLGVTARKLVTAGLVEQALWLATKMTKRDKRQIC